MTASIYLEGLADAQSAYVAQHNEQFRRHAGKPGDEDYDYYFNYLAPNAESYIDETIKRWLAGERVELGFNDERRDLDDRDALLAQLSNPNHSQCSGQEFFLALILPSMIERGLAASVSSEPIAVEVAAFNNCRENGLVYSVMQPGGTLRSFSVYEHRNRDSIIINGCSDWDGVRLPYVADTKWAFFAEIHPGNYEQVVDALTFFLVEASRGELDDDAALAAKVERIDWNTIIAGQLPAFDAFLKARGVKPMDRLREQ